MDEVSDQGTIQNLKSHHFVIKKMYTNPKGNYFQSRRNIGLDEILSSLKSK